MAIRKLTAKGIPGLKPKPNGKRETYWDTVTKGLYLDVHCSGKKTFGVFGKTKTKAYPKGHAWRVTLGEWRKDIYGLADATRDAKVHLLAAATQRVDPAVEKRKMREAGTFGDLVESFLPAAQIRQSTREEWGRLLRHPRLAGLRARPTPEVSRGELVRLFDKIAADAVKDGGLGYSANRTLEAVRRVFTWAIDKELVTASPVVGIKPPIEEEPRQRAYSDEEIGRLVRAFARPMLAEYKPGSERKDPTETSPFVAMTVDAVRLCLWTGCRIESAMGAPVSEFHLPLNADGEVDVDNAVWTIGGTRAGTKNGLPWSVPLVAPAVEMIRRRIGASPWLFPGKVRGDAASGPLHRSQKAMDLIAKASGIEGFRPHDLRRTINTWLASRPGGAWPLEVRDAVLGHAKRGLEGTYNVHSYSAEKRDALTQWANHVERIAAAEPAKVVSIATARRA